jgi:nicotinate-nucleotide adenylyltransferase
MSRRRIGIYGGTFDPIHLGHLLLAETCREQLRLDEVRFVPAHVSPFKTEQYPSDDKQRLEMLQLAIAGQEAFVIDRREIERGGVSYTVETLRELNDEFPEAEFFFLMGADSLADFLKWKEPQEICRLAWIAVVERGGHHAIAWDILKGLLEPKRFQQTLEMKVEMPLMEISSTDLRRRATEGASLRFRMPRAVEQYIRTHRLYCPTEPSV